MKTVPIRWKIAWWSVGLSAAILVLYSVASVLAVHRNSLAVIDSELNGEARHIADLDRAGNSGETADEIMRHEPWLAYAHFDGEGCLRRHSSRLPVDAARAALNAPQFQTVAGPAATWRLKAFRQESDTYVVAYDLKELSETSRNLLSSYAAVLPVVLLIAGAGGWWIAGAALAPVQRLTEAAERVQAVRLDQRVPLPAARDEVQRLAIVFNAMLGRLELSFNQAKRFASDASHELRTPLTIMRGEVEQLLHSPADESVQEDRLLSLQEEIDRLDRVTEHLLLLARFDAGKVALSEDQIDLSALVRDACEDADLLASIHGVSFRTTIAPDIRIVGDGGHIRRVFLNLLQNAMGHNRQDGEATFNLDVTAGRAVARIANTGPEISLDLRSRLFERFARGDGSRTSPGHGLGLSLCREIVVSHGGTITLTRPGADGWIEFTVELPMRS